MSGLIANKFFSFISQKMPLLYDEAYKAKYTKNKKKAFEKTKPVTSAVIMKRDRSLLVIIFVAFVGLDQAKSQHYHSEIADPKKCSTVSEVKKKYKYKYKKTDTIVFI